MLRLVLRLRPSAGLPRSRGAQPELALSSRPVRGPCHLRRYHGSVRSRAVCSGGRFNTVVFASRALLQPAQTQRFYSLPPHQKVKLYCGQPVTYPDCSPPGITLL
ncbi:unnamed protein product [Oncorhynchus mykiss]|uniref:Uncharacterized protein n=1 Tax=Oncorhynchus mykiss TaxID=8022 RepID=A0A060Y3C8_ONCMY|nr:unnamed protein product [Oncorhynchus mykiss]